MKPSRIQPILPRPAGTGAFWDFAAAFGRLEDDRAARVRPRASPARRAAELAEAEERWVGEGGNLAGDSL